MMPQGVPSGSSSGDRTPSDQTPQESVAERLQPRLFGIAYRMLGDVHDAEDVVQEGMLRWQQSGAGAAREPEAWLVAVVTRLAIDRLRRARTERATYPGPWLPEPTVDERLAPDRGVELASDLSMAFLVLLERLAPEERAAFLLREVFDTDYDEIASVLGKSAATARQIVHRARERVRTDRPRFQVPPDAKARLFDRFVAALEADDKEGLMAVLAPAATLTSDGGGKTNAARRVIEGSDRIARMLLSLEMKFGHPFRYVQQQINGEVALAMYDGEKLFAVNFCETDGERIVALYRVMNPDKLTRLK
jgi:RNA polymerase sigma-70 factor (ECF subfamily)